jgi:hypothetical protein
LTKRSKTLATFIKTQKAGKRKTNKNKLRGEVTLPFIHLK